MSLVIRKASRLSELLIHRARRTRCKIKSTLTHLKLATFEAVTGIATREGNLDDDGNASGVASFISDEQVEELTALITETKTDIAKFLEIGKVESSSDINHRRFPGKPFLSKKKKRHFK